MNTTINNLKQEALNELQAETKQVDPETQDIIDNFDQAVEITEIIGEVISLEALQSKLSLSNREANEKKLAELFGKLKDATNMDDALKIHAEISLAMQENNKQVLLDMANLPRYIYYQDQTGSYLIEAKNIPTSTKREAKPKSESKFQSGDLIYLLGKDQTGNEIKSQVYKVTLADLVGMDDHEPIKPSKAVLRFEQSLGNKRAIEAGDKAIFSGLEYHKWHKVSN